jgi:hypothetical protein
MASWLRRNYQVIKRVERCVFVIGLGVIIAYEADDDRKQHQSRRLFDLFMYSQRIVAITALACGFDGVVDPAEPPGCKRV